jgi:hypothetical protein
VASVSFLHLKKADALLQHGRTSAKSNFAILMNERLLVIHKRIDAVVSDGAKGHPPEE